MVQAVFSDGAHEALGERVRPWGADRGDAGVLGVGGDAEEVDDPTFDLDHEEDAGALEEDGVDADEVGREHLLGLGA